MKKKIEVGLTDYDTKGKKNNLVEIEYSLNDGRFSASGTIWLASKRDASSCGQNLEEIASLFPDHELAQRIVKVWRKWHLNDMKAGSPKQEAFLEELDLPNSNHYENAKSKLADAGLDPDESYIHNGEAYSYGSAWLNAELPQSVIDEIESWGGKDI